MKEFKQFLIGCDKCGEPLERSRYGMRAVCFACKTALKRTKALKVYQTSISAKKRSPSKNLATKQQVNKQTTPSQIEKTNCCRYCQATANGLYHMKCWSNYWALKREACQIKADMLFYRQFDRLPSDSLPSEPIKQI